MLYATNLKIPNGLSEAVNPRTDNANRTKEKEQNMIYKTLHRKLRFSNTNHTKNRR